MDNRQFMGQIECALINKIIKEEPWLLDRSTKYVDATLELWLKETVVDYYEIGTIDHLGEFITITKGFAVSEEAAMETAKEEIKKLLEEDPSLTFLGCDVGYIEIKDRIPSEDYCTYCWDSDEDERGIEMYRRGKEISFY